MSGICRKEIGIDNLTGWLIGAIMPTDIICRAVPGGLMAVNGVEAEKLEQFRGKDVMVKISQPRNIQFHRKYFALLGTARDLADTEYNAEQFRAYVTVGAGYCEFITDSDGGVVAIPKSVSFAAMSEDEFERLYQDTLNFICQTWVLNENDINAILNFI